MTICAFTPNPALDLGGEVQKVVPNEKSYIQNETRFPGGNAINAARIVHRLKSPVVLTGFLGGGVGIEIENLLEKEGLNHSFVKIKESSRINITVSHLNTHLQTRLSFPGPKIAQAEREQMLQFLTRLKTGSWLMIGGSLPPGIDISFLKGILSKLNKKKVPLVVDVPGKVLKGLLNENLFLIKPNLTEFQELFSTRVETASRVVRIIRKKLPQIPYVCVSSVEGGALLVAPDGVFFGKIPSIKIRSTVGAGDSMVGAMTALLHQGEQAGSIVLRHGLAAAAATLSHSGTLLGTSREISHYLSRVRVSKFAD